MQNRSNLKVLYTVRKVLADFAVQYLTDDAIAKLCVTLKFRQIVGEGSKISSHRTKQ